jgi:hypothetical protein
MAVEHIASFKWRRIYVFDWLRRYARPRAVSRLVRSAAERFLPANPAPTNGIAGSTNGSVRKLLYNE